VRHRVGQACILHTAYSRIFHTAYDRIFHTAYDRIYTPYITVHLMISLPNLPYILRIYINIYIYGFWPTLHMTVYLVFFQSKTPYKSRMYLVLANPREASCPENSRGGK
jgi:hypothetical protein